MHSVSVFGCVTFELIRDVRSYAVYVTGILPENSKGIVCVVKNNVGQAFTYRVVGEEAEFMGVGDYHEARYHDQAIVAGYSFDANTEGYAGAELDDSAIKYEITVYPSSEMEAQFASRISL